MNIQPTHPRSPQDPRSAARAGAPQRAVSPDPRAPASPPLAAGPSQADRFRSAPAATEPRSSPEQALDFLDRLRQARRARNGAPSTELVPVAVNLLPPSLRLQTRETGHDAVGVAGRPTTLEAKLELSLPGQGFLDPDLAGKEIAFRVDGVLVGSGVTDADGLARVPFTPAAQGRYQITYELARPEDRELLEDDPSGKGALHVFPDRPTLIFDIDQTLSDLPELAVPIAGEKAPAYKNSVLALQRLAQDYNIVYLTARDDALDRKTRGFLFKDHDPATAGSQAFPDGPILYNDLGLTSYREASQMDRERHAATKTEAIKRLQLAGVPLVGGIGNTATDDAAYRGTNLDSFILDNAREAQQPGSFYAELRQRLTDPHKLQAYGLKVQQLVEGRNLTDPAAVLQRDLDILTGTRATTGNALELYIDGGSARPAFLEALGAAHETITYQSFEFLDDPAGRAVAEKLAQKAREGVQVRVVIDAVGSRHLPPAVRNPLVQRLQEAGAEVLVYNPVRLESLADVAHRDHRKAIVIDGGKAAFLGGMNTAEPYLGSDGHPPKYHDIFARLDGPAARDVQDIFTRTWRDAGGELSHREEARLYGNMQASSAGQGPGSVRIVNHIPKEDFHIKDTYLRLIRDAKDHVYVQNSFPMDAELVGALADAARRGVKVRYVYGQLSNLDPLHLVAENKFPELLQAGVEIYRYPQFVHTKSLSVDGRVATVGSSNVDNFSLEMNREAVAVVSDPAWVRDFEKNLHENDVSRSWRVPADPADPFWRNNFTREALDALWPDWLE